MANEATRLGELCAKIDERLRRNLYPKVTREELFDLVTIAELLRDHGSAIAFGLAMTTGSDAETVSEERKREAFAAVKALGELKLDGTKPCPECTGRFACERCGVEVRQSYQPGTCDGTDDCEPRFMNEHDVMGTFRDVNGCDRCHHSGRVPNDEAEK